jgi:hypothetical protein
VENVNQEKAHTALMYDQVNGKGIDVSSSTDDETTKLIDRHNPQRDKKRTHQQYIQLQPNIEHMISNGRRNRSMDFIAFFKSNVSIRSLGNSTNTQLYHLHLYQYEDYLRW